LLFGSQLDIDAPSSRVSFTIHIFEGTMAEW